MSESTTKKSTVVIKCIASGLLMLVHCALFFFLQQNMDMSYGFYLIGTGLFIACMGVMPKPAPKVFWAIFAMVLILFGGHSGWKYIGMLVDNIDNGLNVFIISPCIVQSAAMVILGFILLSCSKSRHAYVLTAFALLGVVGCGTLLWTEGANLVLRTVLLSPILPIALYLFQRDDEPIKAPFYVLLAGNFCAFIYAFVADAGSVGIACGVAGAVGMLLSFIFKEISMMEYDDNFATYRSDFLMKVESVMTVVGQCFYILIAAVPFVVWVWNMFS